MVDPLAEMVTLLQPRTPFSKLVGAAGPWRVRRTETGRPFYCVILEGCCQLAPQGHKPLRLEEGDFVLIPSASDFAMSSLDPVPDENLRSSPLALPNNEFRVGRQAGPADMRFLVGHCMFGSPDAALLVSLLPRLVHVRGEQRLSTLVQLVRDESRAQRPAREVILARLLEVLLIEALRSTAGTDAAPGLVRALADERLAAAIRRMHASPAEPWTVAQLAKESALSRSAFFERFSRALGVAPMEYLLAWRMAMAKQLLLGDAAGIAEVAARVGYSSASAFSVAFARHTGMPPSQYVRREAALDTPPPEAGVA